MGPAPPSKVVTSLGTTVGTYKEDFVEDAFTAAPPAPHSEQTVAAPILCIDVTLLSACETTARDMT